MAQLSFTIADGKLIVGSTNRTYDYASTDYRAKAWRNGDRDGIKVYPLNGDENKPRWSVDNYSEIALVIDNTRSILIGKLKEYYPAFKEKWV